MRKKYLSDIMKDREFNTNTLIVSPTGSGKTHYIINHLCKGKKVLYLCDNSNLEEQVSLENNTRVVKKNSVKHGFGTDIHIMTYKYFGAKIKYDLNYEYIKDFDLIIADEVHNLIDYQTFNNDADLSHAIRALMHQYDNIPIIMFTATPYYLNELAKNHKDIDRYYTTIDLSEDKHIMRYINKREAYINHMSQIQFALEEYKQGFEYNNLKCLIYANRIEDMRFIEDMCIDRKLKPICIWSTHNEKNYMSAEQREVRQHLISNGVLKEPYNVLIINRATETGINIHDENMQLVIVNTVNITQQVQARGRVRHDVDLLIIKTKEPNKLDIITIKDDLLNKWLLKSDIENIIHSYHVKDDKSRYMTVNKFIAHLSSLDYTVEKQRKMICGSRDTLYKIIKNKK